MVSASVHVFLELRKNARYPPFKGAKLTGQSPQVSVLMPVYNEAARVARAIESVLSQTMADFEFVVVDNNSTDNSRHIIQSVADRDSRIIVCEEQQIGIAHALNRGLRIASGDLVARLDADDWTHPNRLRLQSEFLAANPNISIVGSQIRGIGSKGAAYVTQFPLHPRFVERAMRFHDVVAHPSVMFRRQDVLAMGGYRPIPLVEDLDLWLRALDSGLRIANLANVLVDYSLPEGDLVSTTQYRNQLLWAAYARFASACRREFRSDPVEYSAPPKTAADAWQKLRSSQDIPELEELYELRLARNDKQRLAVATQVSNFRPYHMNRVRREAKSQVLYESAYVFIRHQSYLMAAKAMVGSLILNPINVCIRLFLSLKWRRKDGVVPHLRREAWRSNPDVPG